MGEETSAGAASTPPELGARHCVPGWLREAFALLRADRVTLYASLAAAVVLTVSRYHVSTGEYQRFSSPAIVHHGLFAAPLYAMHLTALGHAVEHATAPVGDFLYWFLGSLLLFCVVPLLGARLFRVPLSGFGLGLGDWRYGLKAVAVLYAVMLPFVVGASFTGTFSGAYPMCAGATTSGAALLTYELSYAAYFVGWEFVYRGLLANGLYPRIGAAAILLPAIAFAVMHAGKPEPEAYGAIVAALALGVVAVRARSFWYGALLHASIAITMDVLALAQTHRFPAHF